MRLEFNRRGIGESPRGPVSEPKAGMEIVMGAPRPTFEDDGFQVIA